jgi:hypothetical protein
MKCLILFVLTSFCLPSARGQTFALQTNIGLQQHIDVFTAGDFSSMYRYHKLNKKILWGGIIAASGAVISFSGIIAYSYLGQGDGTSYHPENVAMENTGKGLLITGAAVTATGFILMILGKIEKNRGYSFEVIAPRSNEIGVAYNFK